MASPANIFTTRLNARFIASQICSSLRNNTRAKVLGLFV